MTSPRRWIFAAAFLIACHDEEEGPPARMLDSSECAECHPDHYQQWLGSMHAYASDDPVFLAMNARGQRETSGELGDFCVRCHAPVAVALGETQDGLNLDEVPQHLKGVTCYFCHNVATIEGTHNNPIELAMNGMLLGQYPDPIDNDFHHSDYSPVVDGGTTDSAKMCGSCHDIVNGHGVHLERTYEEWLASFYSSPSPGNSHVIDYFGNSCNNCHMIGTPRVPIADYPGVPSRDPGRRDHRFVGVDLALTDFPDAELGPSLVADQRLAMDAFRAPALCTAICMEPDDEAVGTKITVWLHNEAAGHHWPSGASQDRRAWIQLEAFAGDEPVLRTGVVEPQESIDAAAMADPNLWVLRDHTFDADGQPTEMFWNVATVQSELLTVAAEAGVKYDKTTWASREWHVDGSVDSAKLQVNLRPIPHELVDALVEDGLNPVVKDRIPTHVVAGATIEWTEATAIMTDLEGPCSWSGTCFCNLAMEDGICPMPN